MDINFKKYINAILLYVMEILEFNESGNLIAYYFSNSNISINNTDIELIFFVLKNFFQGFQNWNKKYIFIISYGDTEDCIFYG